ncbi:helix-turn-helix domain-containing protein [Ensifer sp. SL37]|uniref:helix-turn-helix domain-containing protein n=1 Tax=Ensifer sp. SL37 TaxID=2995137 RepID=UPI00227373D0|nr:helix-turn-helix domain-containing protein [Ensifer sp. SL37]MCY1740993.1 helix-turn-helix domain-containing protein [Ensifer sp. SL37]
MINESQQNSDENGATLAAQCVTALLNRHGVPKYRHSVTVAEILGLSYSAGNRRMTMNASWSLEELKQIAEHFNETLQELVAVAKTDSMVEASVVINNRIIPCRLKLGEAITQVPAGTLIAAQIEGGAWRVTTADNKLVFGAHAVTRLLVETTNPRRRVAILDDHADTAEMLKQHLEAAGFEAFVFGRPSQLEDGTDYDAYVLDWIIEEDAQQHTAFALIQHIRARNPYCPILVLTGQIATGAADEQSIAAAMTAYNLKYFQKPLSMPILISALHSSFRPA